MIQAKKKLCKGCNKETYIWARGMCRYCQPKKSINIKPKKPTGEKALFQALWSIREHTCENCLEPLGNEACAQFFSHIQGKGAHAELRLDPKNIQILCRDCHYAFDFQGNEAFAKRKKVKIMFPM